MDNREKDPVKCREFRQAIREFGDRIKLYSQDESRFHDQASKLRSELRELHSKLLRLQLMQIGSDAMDLAIPEKELGGASAGQSARISVIETQIQSRERDLPVVQENIRLARQRLRDAQDRLDRNSDTLNSLNCVRP
jgi:hypothetical protein